MTKWMMRSWPAPSSIRIFSNLTLSCFTGGMLFLRALPHPTAPEKSTFETWFYATGSEDFFTRMLTCARGVSEAERKPVEREWEGNLGSRWTAMRSLWSHRRHALAGMAHNRQVRRSGSRIIMSASTS